MLIKKIISSIFILFITWFVIFIAPNWMYLSLVIAFTSVGLIELFSIIEKKGVFVYKYFGLIAGILIPVSVFMHVGQNHIDLEPLFIVIACLFAFVLQFIRKEKSKDHMISIAMVVFALFYVSWFFSFFVKLKFMVNGNYLVLFLILVTKMGDVAAYFVGRTVGRNKLIPRISPNKTIEGTVGGILTSIAIALCCQKMIGVSIYHAFVLGVLLAILGQMGDLAESLIKRDCGVKDAGGHVPGFGGVLDMIDSLLFTAPIFYFYMKVLQ